MTQQFHSELCLFKVDGEPVLVGHCAFPSALKSCEHFAYFVRQALTSHFNCLGSEESLRKVSRELNQAFGATDFVQITEGIFAASELDFDLSCVCWLLQQE